MSPAPARALAAAEHGREGSALSQAAVESALGRLLTDDAFRRRFLVHPEHLLTVCGMRLTDQELAALQRIEGAELSRVAELLDDRIRRADLDAVQPARAPRT